MAWRTKDVTIMLVDVGRWMQQPIGVGGDKDRVTKADVALGVARSSLQHKWIFTPKHEVGIVLFGTVETRNFLQADGYPYVIDTCNGVVPPGIDAWRSLKKPHTGGEESDAVNGLIIALDLIIRHTKEQKYRKFIYLLTDNHSVAPGDPDLIECTKQFCETDTTLRVVLVGASDWGAWASIAATCPNVELVPLAVAARETAQCVKRVEQRAKVRLPLVISEDVQIPVGIFTKTQHAHLPSLKKRSKLAATVAVPASAPGASERTDGVKVERTYHLADDLDGEEVVLEDRIKGHKYGTSIVPMSEYDEAALAYTAEKTLTALGFVPIDSISPEHSIYHIDAVAADRGNIWACFALESLVDAMLAEQRVIVARYCYRNKAQPWMVALFANKGSGSTASSLTMQYLPFAEDIREWTYASLPKPSIEQSDAIDQLLDAMDLESASAPAGALEKKHGVDVPPIGVATELFKPETTYSPALRRFYDFLVERAVDTTAKVASPAARELMATIEPPSRVAERLQMSNLSEKLKTAFVLEKVEKQAGKKKRRFWREAVYEKRKDGGFGEVDIKRIKIDDIKKDEKEEEKVKDERFEGVRGPTSSISGMAAPVELPPRVHIGPAHPERDFERWLACREGGVDVVGTCIEQMKETIENFAEEGDELHSKALSCLTVLRSGCVKEGEPIVFNAFARKLQLAGTSRRARFWEQARRSGLGLITDAEVSTSTVTVEEARAFLAGDSYRSTPIGSEPPVAEMSLLCDLGDTIM